LQLALLGDFLFGVFVMQALLAVQLDTGCCVKLVETDVDLAKMVLQYTKAVAERPFK